MNRDLLHPRDEIMKTMERIYRSRMTTTSGGNLSIRDEAGDIWITPARIDKGNLQRNDIVCVRADGTIDGKHQPSSEFPFHQSIYNVRPDVNSIVHAHPVALVAFSICRQIPETKLFHQAHAVCGQTGFAEYALPGSEALGRVIAEQFRDGCDSVILENHGVVVGGESLSRAFQLFEAFEFAAKTIIKGNQLAAVRYLSDSELQQAQGRSIKLGAFRRGHVSILERELRKDLCDFIRRGCRQRLLISTEGSFSARLNDQAFLITPTHRDRESLNVGDLVLLEQSRMEDGKKASRAVLTHQAIYKRHRDVNAIVFAHPVNATAFSVTGEAFDAKTIPESYVFLRDVTHVPYGIQYRDDGQIAECVSSEQPVAILENDGVLVTGKTVLDAFDRLQVLEATAEAVINSRAIGEISSMSSEKIAELRTAFKIE